MAKKTEKHFEFGTQVETVQLKTKVENMKLKTKVEKGPAFVKEKIFTKKLVDPFLAKSEETLKEQKRDESFLIKLLHSPDQLKHQIVLREILGPPIALRPPEWL